MEPQIIEDLGEMKFGDWEGFSFDELAQSAAWERFNQHRGLASPPGGESMLECQARVVTRLELLRERHPNQMIAVFSHADPLRAAIVNFLGAPLDSMLRFELHPASISVVQVDEHSARVMCINTAGELPI